MLEVILFSRRLIRFFPAGGTVKFICSVVSKAEANSAGDETIEGVLQVGVDRHDRGGAEHNGRLPGLGHGHLQLHSRQL